jgi:outer membrane protein assembly factor BamB
MTRRLLLGWAVIGLLGLPVRAQTLWPVSSTATPGNCQCDGWAPAATTATVPCPPASGSAVGGVIPHPYRTQFEPSPPPCGLPTRTALARIGLERHWFAVVPLTGDEQVLGISLSDSILFARTSKGYIHTYDVESGRPIWSVRLGDVTSRFTPASVNTFAVFVANLNRLFALDRRTGNTIWVKELSTLPSCPTACDEDRVMVGFTSGKLYGFGLKVTENAQPRISEKAIDVWNWQTSGEMQTRPLPAGKFVVFASDDGKIYVALADEPTMLYRIATGGPIGSGIATHGTRLMMAPSADHNLYGIDLMTAQVLWSYPSGAPIQQEPLVSQDDVYIVNTAGQLTSLDTSSGSPRWAISTQGGPLITVGTKRIYLKSLDNDLFIVDRVTGQMVADPRSTYERAGLNLRCFDYNPTNRFNDRLYFATTSGTIVALREAGALTPKPHRDPKALPFGYIPPEGISLTPKPPVPEVPAAPGAETPPAPDKPGADKPPADKPAEEKPEADK